MTRVGRDERGREREGDGGERGGARDDAGPIAWMPAEVSKWSSVRGESPRTGIFPRSGAALQVHLAHEVVQPTRILQEAYVWPCGGLSEGGGRLLVSDIPL